MTRSVWTKSEDISAPVGGEAEATGKQLYGRDCRHTPHAQAATLTPAVARSASGDGVSKRRHARFGRDGGAAPAKRNGGESDAPAPKGASRTLVIYSIFYPFGVTEVFLGAELKVLSELFERIYIVPISQALGRRELPNNVQVIGPVSHSASLMSKVRRRARVASVLGWTLLRSKDRWKHLNNWNAMRSVANRELGRQEEILGLLRNYGLEDAVHYNYWMLNSSLSLVRLRQAGVIRKLVCRTHGFDLYDERHPICIPYREYRAKGFDAIVTVSRHGERYLRDRLNPIRRRKVHRYRLGIATGGTCLGPEPKAGDTPLILSCSRMHEVKRLPRIISALKHLSSAARWVHIGDGHERPTLEAAASELPPPISWEFAGELDNNAVYRFYRETPVALFLNTSRSEGLPVSMMEAVAFGVPIVATDVGGVAEIVDRENGLLIDVDADGAKIARVIEEALYSRNWNRPAIREAALERFDADANFRKFGEFLLSL